MTTSRNTAFKARTICIILCTVWAVAFWSTLCQATKAYIHSGYDYQGLIIVPMVLLLVDSKRQALKRAHVNYTAFGQLALLLSSLLWIIATIVDFPELAYFACIAMLTSIFWANFGKKITSILALPLMCLFFLMPIGNICSHALQETFTNIMMNLLTACKISVYWQNGQIIAQNQAYDLHAYLNNTHNVLSFIAISILYTAMISNRFISRVITLIGFIILPFLSLFSGLFIYIICHKYVESAKLNLTLAGCACTIFGMTIAALFGYKIRGGKRVIHTDNIDWRDSNFSPSKFLQPLIIGICAISIAPYVAYNIISLTTSKNNLMQIPSELITWKLDKINKNNNVIWASFKKDKKIINVNIAKDHNNIQGNWQPIKSSYKKIPLRHKTLSVHEKILQSNKNKYKMVWQINYINGRYTNNRIMTKIFLHKNTLRNKYSASGMITISMDISKELNQARSALTDFVQEFDVKNS